MCTNRQVFCRVHVDDIVGALLHCLRLPAAKRPSIVNVCDNRPAPAVNCWATRPTYWAARCRNCTGLKPFKTA